MPLRNLSRKDPEFVTAAATSALDTVTNFSAVGSVLASHAEVSDRPRRVNGCFCDSEPINSACEAFPSFFKFTHLHVCQCDPLDGIFL